MKCPFNKMRPCDVECALYRKGIRYFDNNSKPPEPFEMCTLNYIADVDENVIERLLTLTATVDKQTASIAALVNLLGFAVEKNMKRLNDGH